MSTSDGNSTTRPLRRRQSKRFDRSGGSPLVTGPTVLDTEDGEVEVDAAEPGHDASAYEVEESIAATEVDPTPSSEPEALPDPGDGGDAEPSTTTLPGSHAPTDGIEDRPTDTPARHRTLDQIAPCGRCGHDVSIVHIEVDGNVLMMESCDNCDTRRWQLAGEPIELQQALDHVGEHTGRRR